MESCRKRQRKKIHTIREQKYQLCVRYLDLVRVLPPQKLQCH